MHLSYPRPISHGHIAAWKGLCCGPFVPPFWMKQLRLRQTGSVVTNLSATKCFFSVSSFQEGRAQPRQARRKPPPVIFVSLGPSAMWMRRTSGEFGNTPTSCLKLLFPVKAAWHRRTYAARIKLSWHLLPFSIPLYLLCETFQQVQPQRI